MLQTVNFKPDEEYFAAANSYAGFISKFHLEFEPKLYERIFILKGGPGTGKSTLMRGIGSYFSNMNAYVKAIYCSSDIHSLDGVVLRYNDRSICVIDGTAPHVFEPEYPGAKEEIVNLASGFNNVALRKNSERIIALCATKRAHYKSAYSLLDIAGKINDKILYDFSKTYDYSRAEFIIKELVSELKIEKSTCVDWRYISCFNKDKYVRLSCFDSCERLIKIRGNGYSEYLFMSQLLSYIGTQNTERLYYTPLSDKMIESIKTAHFTLITDNTADDALDTSAITEPSTELTRLISYKTSIEDLAAEAFLKASVSHFELEKIYKEATSFANNEEIFGQLIAKIRLYLELP